MIGPRFKHRHAWQECIEPNSSRAETFKYVLAKKKKLATRQFVFAARFQFFDRVITPAALLGGAAHNMFRRFDNIKNVFGKLLTLGHEILLIGPPYSMKPYILECEKEQNHNIMD